MRSKNALRRARQNSEKPSKMEERKRFSVSPPPMDPQRRLRSRSSPTRKPSIIVSYRSPSVSPSRTFVKIDSQDLIPSAAAGNAEQRIFSLNVLPAEAYFSPKPPAQPLRIVLIGEIPRNICPNGRFQRLIENLRRIETSTDSGYGHSGATMDATTLESKSSVPDLSQLKAQAFPSTPPVDTSDPSEPKHSCSSLIKDCLDQLITDLPLSGNSSITEIAHHHKRNVSLSSSRLRMLTKKQYLAPQNFSRPVSCSPIRSKCSIAVQALSNKYSMSEVSHTSEGPTEVRVPEEWVGGVRALRDSHVRLVLRQLRHIDRLNRALDRATRSPCRPNKRYSRPTSVPH